MSDITLRNVKGTPLTNQEVDDNFSNLNTDKYQAGDSPTFADITADSINITGSVGTSDITASSIQITGGTGTQGTISWNTEDETLDLIVSDDVTYQLGQELGFVARNLSGQTLANGAVVRATGASGDKLTINIADATTELGSAPTVGVVTETIGNNSTGRVTTAGFVRSLDTSTIAEGSAIYLGTNGTFTATQPTSPSHLVHIGWVIRSHATEGSILVHVNNGWELEELHNVLITSVADNEVLQWNAASSVWENRTLAEANIAELNTSVSFQDVTIGGDLTVSGTLTTINAQDLAIADNMIYLNDGSTNTNPDLGFAANYNDGSYKHAGLFRDADDGRWKFYDSYTLEPDAAIYIDTSHASFAYAPIQASVVYASSSNSDNWTTAYGWGNHATAGYQPANTALTTSTNFNGDVTGVYNNLVITGYNNTNWDTAYGWGDHSAAGYLTAVPDNYVLTAGDTMTGDLSISKAAATINLGASTGPHGIQFYDSDSTLKWGFYYRTTPDTITFELDGSSAKFTLDTSGNLTLAGTLSASGYNNTNWDTAYTYSQVGHLPLAGGTTTGAVTFQHDNFGDIEIKRNHATNSAGIKFSNNTGQAGILYAVESTGALTWRNKDTTNAYTVWHSGNLTDNSSNWNTAYGWGNHATAGYLTSASLTGYATETYVNTAVSNLVDSAPATLDTLNELAAALGDDPNFATTVTNSIATKLPLSGGTLTGALQFNDANTRIQEGNSNALRIQTNSGWTDIGPQNTNWTHIQTDRAGFFTNKKLHVDGDIFVYGTQSQLTSSSVRAPIFYDTNNTSYYVDPAGDSVLSKMYLADQLRGGIGAKATSGITDWNDSSNARSGNGYTLLLGTHANGPGTSYYYHPFSFEYNSKDGSGNMTQFAFDYSGANGPFFRTRYSGAWTGWTRLWNSSNHGSGSGLDADLLDGQHGSYYAPVSSLNNYVLKTGDTMTGALTIQLNAESSRAPTALTLHSTMGDINGAGDTDGTFIEFKATDGNATFTPQVKIGMLVKDYTGDGGIPSEGTGNFVVYTAQGTDSGGSGTLTERFRVREDGPLYAGSDRVFADNYHPNADKWTTARTNTVTLTGDVTGSGSASVDGTGNWTVSLSTAVGNDSHSHSFDGLTGKTSGTGDYSTNGDLVAGRGSGSIALTINDGKGNSNVTFNHQNGVPDQNGNAARIEVNTDSTSGASMNFELKSNVTGGTSVDLTSILNLSESQVTSYKTLYENSNRVFTDAYHPNADKWTTARTNTVTLTGAVTGSGSASVDGSGNWTVTVPTTTNHTHNYDNYGSWTAKDHDGTTYTVTSGDTLWFKEGGAIDVNFTADDELTISHADTSTQASVDNANGTVIQDVTLDTYGHITGLASVDLDGRYVREGGTAFSGTYPMVSRIGARNIYSNGNITFNGTTNGLTVSGRVDAPVFYDSNDTGFFLDPNASGDPATTSLKIRGGIRWHTDELDFSVGVHSGMEPMSLRIWDNYTQTGAPQTYGTVLDIYGRSGHWRHQFHYLGSDLQFRSGGYGSETWSGWQSIFHDGYHPNADKWTTARTNTVTLTGDVTGTGSASVNGSGNWTVSIGTTVADDSHSHTVLKTSGNYVWSASTTAGSYPTTGGSPGIQTSFVRQSDGWPDYGAVLHVGARGGSDAGGDFQIYCGHGSANGGNYLRVRNADNSATPTDSWTSWRTIWDSGNDGSGSGLDADLLDGQHGSYYAPATGGNYVAKSGDTMTGALTYTKLVGPDGSSRDKIRVYSSSLYAIGMQSAITYGGLNDWAMTFQFNNDADRGFWWGHDGHTTAQGAMSLTTAGHLFVGSRVDAPVFYDSDNTSYYANFSSVNRSINVAGGIHQTETHRPNVQWSSTSATGAVLITLPGTSSQYDMVSIEIDVYEYNSTAGSKIYISGHNWNTGWLNNSVQVIGSFNKPIYLGRDGNDYFIQLGDVGSGWTYGTVNVTQVTTAGFYSLIDWAVGWNIGLVTTLPTYLQVTTNLNDGGDATLKTNGYIYSPSSVRSPIFYDSNDTNYYVDPSSRSRLLSLTTRNRISIGSNGNLPYEDTGEAGIWYSGTSSNATWFLGLNGATTSADFRFYAGGNRFLFTQGGTGTATADWRAPIFYDYNNTNYYGDFGNTSRMNSVYANQVYLAAAASYRFRFWGGSDNYAIGMSDSGNATYGGRAPGETTSDYNMYFTMAGGTNRGFVFRNTNNAGGAVAGIDSTGIGYFKQLRFGGLNRTIAYDFDGTGTATSADALAYLKFGSGISTGVNLAAVECISPNWSAISGVTYADNKFRIMSARGSAEDALKAAVNLSTVNGEGDTTIIGNVNIDGTNTRLVSGIGISGLDVYVVGDLIGSGDITAYSDERLKENIETLDGSKVYEMRGVSFTKDGKAGSGVVAQELEKVAPELVHDSGEYKSVAYGNLVGYLIEAVKELKAEVEDLKTQLSQKEM